MQASPDAAVAVAERGAAAARRFGAALFTQWLVLSFYALDALFMAGFALLGVAPSLLPFAFGVAGCGLTLLFAWAVQLGLHRRIGAATFTSLQLMSACVLMLATAAWVPQLGLLLLLTVIVALATSAVQMQRAHLLVVTLVVAVCALLLLVVHGVDLGLPLENHWERVLSGLWFSVVLAKLALINLMGSALRQALVKSNEQLAAALAQVRELSERDELTGLPNRRSAMQQLEQAMGRQARGGEPFAVAILDIDHFKRVNDNLGHAMGDHTSL